MSRKKAAKQSQVVQDTAKTPGVDVQMGDISNSHQVAQLGEMDQTLVDLRKEDAMTGDVFNHPYYPVFRSRVLELLSRLPPNVDDKSVLQVAKETWKRLCEGMNGSADPMDVAMRDTTDEGNVKLGAEAFDTAMDRFDELVKSMTDFTKSQFDRSNSFGFWSKGEGQALAVAVCDLTLETSGVGAVFDGMPSLDNRFMSWDLQLWGALSRAYATAVAEQVRGGDKQIHVCMGAGATADNIWGSIESAAIQVGLIDTGAVFEDAVTYHAVAPKSATNRREYDDSVRDGQFPGTLYSGKDADEARRCADLHYYLLEAAEAEREEDARVAAEEAELEQFRRMMAARPPVGGEPGQGAEPVGGVQ